MKIKRYVAETTRQAMYKLKNDIGSDAIIVNIKKVKKKGFLGIFKKPLVEIVAIDDDEKKEIDRFKEYNNNMDTINTELHKLRNAVQHVSNNVSNNYDSLKNEFVDYRNIMVNNGVNYNIATSILNKIGEQVNVEGKSNNIIKNIIFYNIKKYLGEPQPIKIGRAQKIIFFIGPTGVGKTTTLAKLAARLILQEKYNVGLITSDTYRIAAIEQLKIYSEILNIPLKVIYKPEEMYLSLAELEDRNVILVDTAGRSHKDDEKLDEVKQLINCVNNKEVYLVLSVTTNFDTLKSILKQYNFVDNYKIIFTKIDEAENYGNILNVKFHSKSYLSYITMGQNVPDDIAIVDTNKITNILVGEN